MAYEPAIRLTAFLGAFVILALWELGAPRRAPRIGRRLRWPGNLGVVAIDTVLVRILFPTAPVGVALLAEAHQAAGDFSFWMPSTPMMAFS
jgi:hypothetical protein